MSKQCPCKKLQQQTYQCIPSWETQFWVSLTTPSFRQASMTNLLNQWSSPCFLHTIRWGGNSIGSFSEMVLLSFAPLCPNGNSPASRLFRSGWNRTLLSLLYSGITFIHKATILSIAGEFRNTWFFNLSNKLIELVASGKLRQLGVHNTLVPAQ